eukprot:TRINITY_DN1397_c0_g1_i1.p1 TRINITY_DN1397_c0_g1~~TRINITY_DN1397_c0_g1_i1.p1  ORF type:complete len:187 (-),score=7.63 TRINITY_DN1397_c0_g1_i1:363-923(-)
MLHQLPDDLIAVIASWVDSGTYLRLRLVCSSIRQLALSVLDSERFEAAKLKSEEDSTLRYWLGKYSEIGCGAEASWDTAYQYYTTTTGFHDEVRAVMKKRNIMLDVRVITMGKRFHLTIPGWESVQTLTEAIVESTENCFNIEFLRVVAKPSPSRPFSIVFEHGQSCTDMCVAQCGIDVVSVVMSF